MQVFHQSLTKVASILCLMTGQEAGLTLALLIRVVERPGISKDYALLIRCRAARAVSLVTCMVQLVV